MIRILKESETKREAIFAREDPVGSVEEPVREIIAPGPGQGRRSPQALYERI